MKRVLRVSAHPDDDILGCGGFIAKYISRDVEFRVVFIAEGTTCRYEYSRINDPGVREACNQRNSQGKQALQVLGVQSMAFYNLPCGRLDQTPIIDINKIIEKEIREFQPDTVFTHSGNDANNDHVVIHRSTIMATRPLPSSSVKSLYAYEILSSSEWRFTETFLPSYFEVLDDEHIRLKQAAIEKYETEVQKFPHPRSLEGIITLAKFRGMQCGAKYAEAFSLIRAIRS
jgi:LmbE family N-acetylglucosaminyl deacetylase